VLSRQGDDLAKGMAAGRAPHWGKQLISSIIDQSNLSPPSLLRGEIIGHEVATKTLSGDTS